MQHPVYELAQKPEKSETEQMLVTAIATLSVRGHMSFPEVYDLLKANPTEVELGFCQPCQEAEA